ncbi:hypothetical protein [Bacillus thuringiensis]|nr:hypothetical protein [Bacillus thuringiensis]
MFLYNGHGDIGGYCMDPNPGGGSRLEHGNTGGSPLMEHGKGI